jgi:tetratricopeptide (TPR) repeat protein
LHEVYVPRIQHGNAAFTANVLGARGQLLSVLAHFFEHGRWGSLVQIGVGEQSLIAEDQLFVLMQAALYLTATRGYSTADMRICHERAESLCRSLNRPLLLYSALIGQWRYCLMTDKLSVGIKIAERVYSLSQEQNDAALMVGVYASLAANLFLLGDFKSARQYAMRGVQIWRSGGVQSSAEEYYTPAVGCLVYLAMSEWHFGEIASGQATMAEAISLAKELNDANALAYALSWAASLACCERNRAEVDRLASGLVELCTRHAFVHWLAIGAVWRGWARSACGDAVEGIPWIERGIKDCQVIGVVLGVPGLLARKAEALHLADRTSEALETINEAEALAERFEQRVFSAELHRPRGVFLAALGADETQIVDSFRAAISTATGQKSVSLAKRAEETYAEYRRQKASGSEAGGFRLPLW